MNSTEFLLVVQAGTNALDKHVGLAKRITKIKVTWEHHPKGECGENYLPNIEIEFAPPIECDCEEDY